MDEDTSQPGDVPEPAPADEPSPPEVTPEQPAPDTEPSTEPSEPSPADEDQPDPQDAPVIDEKLKKFALSQGIELDSPNAIKAATIALKSRSEATRNHQRTTELEKSLNVKSDEYADQVADEQNITDPIVLDILKRQQRSEVKEAVNTFWSQEGYDRSIEPTMIELLKDKPYLAADLEALYAVAERKIGRSTNVKQEGAQQALKKLAQNQEAAVPKGAATTRLSPAKKNFSDLSIEEMEKRLGFVQR